MKLLRTMSYVAVAVAAVIVVLLGSPVWAQTDMRDGDVLFVCKHGNVKSLMAASYFNRLAAERGLPYRAAARGSDVDAAEVPTEISTRLAAEGFKVGAFRAMPPSAADVERAERIILIETALPDRQADVGSKIERWDDVPPASVDYSAARDALRAHVERLLDQLSTR
jgi:arsenate reductase (thioredoxin)